MSGEVKPGVRALAELRSNTIATWLWGQATLVASIISLPVLTRTLSTAEFGLWAQLVGLGALAGVADFGMTSVFVRRINAHPSAGGAYARAARRFYLFTAGSLTLVLLAIALLPGGLVTPFHDQTRSPSWAAMLVIGAIGANVCFRPWSVILIADGRLARERVFGAGPAVVGTLLCVVAASVFGTALAVAATYAVVEVAFDFALFVSTRPGFRLLAARARDQRARIRDLIGESSAVLIVDLVPSLALAVDAALIARLRGPSAVGAYAVALRVGDTMRRFFSPFAESLYVSFCRATEDDSRRVLHANMMRLPLVVVTLGMAATLWAAALAGPALRFTFGDGYETAAVALVVILATSTVRTALLPFVRRLQAAGALGPIPAAVLTALSIHGLLGYWLTERYSISGTAVALFVSLVAIEVPGILLALRRVNPDEVNGALRHRVARSIVWVAMIGVAGVSTATLADPRPSVRAVFIALGCPLLFVGCTSLRRLLRSLSPHGSGSGTT